MKFETEIGDCIHYLGSRGALESLEADAYWPKWDGPWWRMLLLHEMGFTKQIPKAAIDGLVASLSRMPLKIFPIHAGEMPLGLNPYREVTCHCQLGNVYQVLAEWGVNVDHQLPWTDDERIFIERGAQFLIRRKLTLGSQTNYNANERESAKEWINLSFPRFYFYDVLRGLVALLFWADKTGQPVPTDAIDEVVAHLSHRFPDGRVLNDRLSYAGAKTLLPPDSSVGNWVGGNPAKTFPLLTKVSAVGEESLFLTRQWAHAKSLLERLSGVEK